MKTARTLLCIALAATLAACNAPRDEAERQAASAEQAVESNMQSAMDKAREELANGNISLGATGGPDAEITPQGDLLIDGKPVAINDAQRRLLLDYRAQLAAVASAGMDVGVQGAQLAAKAVGEAVRGIFSGKPDEIEQRVEAQAEPIRRAALQLCDRLPQLLATQQKLAAAVPEFAPYAKMDANDVEDCQRETRDGLEPPAPEAPAAPVAPDAPEAPASGNPASA